VLQIHTLKNFTDNYCYIIQRKESAVVVDPGETQPVIHHLRSRQLELKAILITHAHFDHCGGAQQLKNMYRCRVVGSDKSGLAHIDHYVADGDTMELCGIDIVAMKTPGHTSDHVCYYIPSRLDEPGVLFTGDTLFAGGCGRIGDCTPGRLYDSLHRLAGMPGDTLVYCGHEYSVQNYMFAASVEPDNDLVRNRLISVREAVEAGKPTVPTTIEEERSLNVFLRTGQDELKKAIGLSHASAVEVFAELRRQKDIFA
jgi:hydroxyacylglutathione hydrolase